MNSHDRREALERARDRFQSWGPDDIEREYHGIAGEVAYLYEAYERARIELDAARDRYETLGFDFRELED